MLFHARIGNTLSDFLPNEAPKAYRIQETEFLFCSGIIELYLCLQKAFRREMIMSAIQPFRHR